MATIYLVRHGQASFGSENYDQLSPLGYKQAEVTGRWFNRLDKNVTGLISGSLQRHLQTRDSFLKGYETTLSRERITIDERLNEMQFQKMLLAVKPELSAPGGLQNWLDCQPDRRKAYFSLYKEALERWICDGEPDQYDESWHQFQSRCLGALQDTASQLPASGEAVVVTSGGPISAISMALYGIEGKKLYEVNRFLMNTGVTAIKFTGGKFSLLYSNNFAHLEEKGREYLTMV